MSLPTRQTSHGFTLTELMVSVVLTSLGVMTFVPMVEQRVKQTTVDSYTSKIESGIIQMKANMVSRQGSCRITLPNGSGTETEITAKALSLIHI